KDTTGLLVVCKNDRAHQNVAAQLKEHSITRRYEAICMGVIDEDELCIDANIGRSSSDRKKMAVVTGGKRAVTHVKVLERFQKFTHIRCELETGRTHQIRVHMASVRHPLLGDEVYGGPAAVHALKGVNPEGQCLHAGVLGFIHPSTGEYIEFTAELPRYFQDIMQLLRST
ncbi:MAG: RNA pseudouridine synthase, partial [Lachnospiraceae bacterium]|nr:RNA pseudouridine synthase [Lachnospiraceae bacterium]